MRTAILVDGSFFLRRYCFIYGAKIPKETAEEMHQMCCAHLYRGNKSKTQDSELYRIFFYDCPPMTKKAHHPVSGKAIDFSKSTVAKFRNELLLELKKLRKVAVRLGYIDSANAHWAISPDKTKALLAGKVDLDDLTDDDVIYEARSVRTY